MVKTLTEITFMNQLLKLLNRWKTTSGMLLLLTIFFSSIIDFNVNDPEEMILGKWYAENDSTYIWEFNEGSQHFTYSDDELVSERAWQIVDECEGETADNEEDFAMLEISRGQNVPNQCYVVQGLNGVLTLLAIPQGRLLIFDRENWTDNYATEKATAHQDTIHTGYQVFEPIMPELRDKTIPLRLPSFLDADELTEPQQLYALVDDTPANRYSIQISVLPECNWNNFCIVGAVHGEDVEEEQQPENSQKVSLRKNIEGYFIESVCNAFCNRAKLIWFENNIKYTVEQKAAPKQTMIWIANSAIESSIGS
ncbi:hypothetical protein CWD77_11895 [Rhodohalobacter barkolensis]|uniref:Uncharacterized protein n=2 Tax=Rhodohalobacter barkolensis TaxID=2053187 RepID=A0A2N0VGJ4_9BACT|nr:hypothetical protein CWD77_11895 [Rhodohalobacter barkolensis]